MLQWNDELEFMLPLDKALICFIVCKKLGQGSDDNNNSDTFGSSFLTTYYRNSVLQFLEILYQKNPRNSITSNKTVPSFSV